MTRWDSATGRTFHAHPQWGAHVVEWIPDEVGCCPHPESGDDDEDEEEAA